MPTKEHEEYQSLQCVMCLTNCKAGQLNQGHKILIQKHVYQKYFDNEDFLPKSICSGCQARLLSQEKMSPRDLPDLKYQDLVANVRQHTRAKSLRGGSVLDCECELCRLGKASGLKNQGAGKSPFLGQELKKRGRPSDEASEKTTGPRCNFCHGISLPKDHLCTKEARLNHILESCSPNSCEILASEVIKKKMVDKNSKEIELKCKRSVPLQIQVKNCDHLAPPTPDKPILKAETLMKLRSRLNLSGRKIALAGSILAEDAGVKLEPYFNKMLIEKGQEAEDFFDVTTIECDSKECEPMVKGKEKKHKKIMKKAVYCVNVEQLVYFIKQKRGIDEDDEDILFKIGLGTIHKSNRQDLSYHSLTQKKEKLEFSM